MHRDLIGLKWYYLLFFFSWAFLSFIFLLPFYRLSQLQLRYGRDRPWKKKSWHPWRLAEQTLGSLCWEELLFRQNCWAFNQLSHCTDIETDYSAKSMSAAGSTAGPRPMFSNSKSVVWNKTKPSGRTILWFASELSLNPRFCGSRCWPSLSPVFSSFSVAVSEFVKWLLNASVCGFAFLSL